MSGFGQHMVEPTQTIDLSAIKKPSELTAAYKTYYDNSSCMHVLAICANIQVVSIPTLVGLLVHYIEKRVEHPGGDVDYTNGLKILLIVYIPSTIFSVFCEWLSQTHFVHMGQKMKYAIAFDLSRQQVKR